MGGAAARKASTAVSRLKKHLSVANLISCMALFVALSGVAVAAKATLGKNQVKAQNIAKEAITSPKLKNNAVISAKLATNSVINGKIANGAVSSGKLANGAVRSSALGGSVVTSGKIKNDNVTTEKLASSAVSTEKLSANAVSTGKLQDGAVSSAKLSSTLFAQLIKNVTYVNKESGAVSATSPQSATAECPAGKQAIGGGARVISGDATVVQLAESIPFLASSGQRTGWTAAAKTSEAGKTFAVEAYAICAEL